MATGAVPQRNTIDLNKARRQGAYRLQKTELELRKKQGRGWTMENESKMVRKHAAGKYDRPQTARPAGNHHGSNHNRGNHGGSYALEPVDPFLPQFDGHFGGGYCDEDDDTAMNVDWNASTKLANPTRWVLSPKALTLIH